MAAVVSWAGARGVLPLAAALSIPLTDNAGAPLPGRGLALLLTTAVIVITLTGQGFTLAPLARRMGVVTSPDATADEATMARREITRAALDYLDRLTDDDTPAPVMERLRHDLERRLRQLDAPPVRGRPHPMVEIDRGLRRDVIATQNAELNRLYADGIISDATRRRIQRSLDLADAGLGEPGEH
jgi:CPA1 family monovalent cation:H+ antiporter